MLKRKFPARSALFFRTLIGRADSAFRRRRHCVVSSRAGSVSGALGYNRIQIWGHVANDGLWLGCFSSRLALR